MAGRLTLGSALRWNQSANMLAPVNVVRISRETIRRDVVDGGPGEIRGELPGLTTFDGVPGRARVCVLDRSSPRLIRGTRSAADGTYRITHLKLGVKYLVLGIDENNQDNAVVMDRVEAGVP